MAAKKATATKAKAAKKTAPAKKTPAKKAAPAKKASTPTTPAKKNATKATSTAQKNGSAKTSTKKAPATKASTAKASAKKTTARKSAGTAPARKVATRKHAATLVVREDESPWTPEELKEVRAELDAEIERLRTEIASSESELSEFLKEPIDGAGDDQADAGAKSFEREHELSLVAGARTGLEQNLHALERLEDGTYGICESCGNPIGKLRLQAYPRATLCMSCKSKQERR